MLNKVLAVLLFSCGFGLHAQSHYTPDKKTYLGKLTAGDSLTYYQCHVEAGSQEIQTESGQTLKGNVKNLSVTEKFVLYLKGEKAILRHYLSPMTAYPNRRFSGLKFKEKPYWEFQYANTYELSERGLQYLQAMEYVGKDATEYDYVISKRNPNQLILVNGNKCRQVALPEKSLIANLCKPNKP